MVTVNNNVTATISAAITGTSALTTSGAGTLVLTGNNTSTGTTTIAGNTLQIGNGGTTGSVVGNIVDNGTLVFDRSDNLTYSGNISGTGNLAQTGAGTVTLTGNNTYVGNTNDVGPDGNGRTGTIVHTGTLEVSGGSLTHPNAVVSVGVGTGSNAIFKVTNGATATVSDLWVGGADWGFNDAGNTGTFIIHGGSSVTSEGAVFFGCANGGIGHGIVDGTGTSLTIKGDLSVGLVDNTGVTSTLAITNGAAVLCEHWAYLAANGTAGSVIVDGAGSSLTFLGGVDMANGNASVFTLAITNGGSVTTSGSMYSSPGNITASLGQGSGGLWNRDPKIIGYTAFYYASRMINDEWLSASQRHPLPLFRRCRNRRPRRECSCHELCGSASRQASGPCCSSTRIERMRVPFKSPLKAVAGPDISPARLASSHLAANNTFGAGSDATARADPNLPPVVSFNRRLCTKQCSRSPKLPSPFCAAKSQASRPKSSALGWLGLL